MPLTARRSYRRRRKNPDEKVPERPGESSAQVMAPTRMKLRVRRRDNAAATGEEERTRESSSSRRKNTSKTTTAAAAAATAASPPASSASASRTVMAAEEASPDSKCPICLDRFNNLAYLDRCLHRFCFPCIQEWSHNKAECPLCKQPFASILHSVRAEDDFKEYTLRPAPANSSVAATVAMVAAMASAARSDHQMRLMLRRHRVADGGETTARRRRRERGGRGGGRRGEERAGGVWEWYLDSPPLPLPSLPPLPQRPDATEDSEDGDEPEERRLRGGADLAERGVIFEGLTGLGGAVDPAAPNNRTSRRLLTRLAARQRLLREGGTVRRLREREMVVFRRALYRCGIRVSGVAGNQGQQQQRDITAESFRRNPAHLNRLRPWLRRELTVLYGAHISLVDIVQRFVMAQLAHYGLEDTHTMEQELRPFLSERAEHFLHELVSFARSPLSLDNYDLQATYDLQALYELPVTALQVDGMSSSSDSSSVIAISEGEEGGGANDDVIQTGRCLSLSGWDDETPGPSYSTAEPSCSLSFSPAPQEPTNEEGGEKRAEEGEEECLIVGYKKPIAERTPELVQLSSDTEEEKKEEEEPEKPPPLPSTAPPPYLPTIPPSTSGIFRDEPDDGEKDGEAGPQRSRARSWSGSSRNSVCTLSPATPEDGERRRERASWRDGKQPGGEEVREKRRRKRRRRRGRERKSGTLYNPNRSIYPAMMRRRSRSPSPFRSSAESGSPPDSSWEYHCSQVSPLTSSVSSPSCSSSSSPFCSSPPPPLPQTPPSLSPSSSTHHGEKPGGKRKYKSRHLDSDVKDPTWRPSSSHQREKRREKERRRRRERKSSRRSREDRSPSVEIIYEGTVTSDTAQPRATKRRRRRHRRTQPGSSPVIITLDSDSSHEDANNKTRSSSSSSSPLSSQQTVDFSDLPPLSLVHSTGVGGALDAEIGELPVDILDRGSDCSESESKGPIAIDNSDDGDVDVENVEEGGAPAVNTHADQPIGEKASPSDRHLLATILDDLKGISAPKPNRPLNSEAGWSAEAQSQGVSVPSPPPLKHPKECRVQEETRDVPPLLRQASPVQSYNRNTPPPLKHKDAGSPRCSPADLHHDPVVPPVLAGSNPIDSRLAAEPPSDEQTIPPISTLKRHLTSVLAPSVHSTPPSFETSPLRHPELGSVHPAALHSSAEETPAPVNSHPVNSSTDFRSVNSWSKEEPAHTDSTSRNKTVGLHPLPAGSGAFSGVNDTSSPAPVSSVDSRTPSAELHSGTPESTTDLRCSASDGPKPVPESRPHPASLNSSCFAGHLNHTALPTTNFTTSQSTAKPQNHVDPQFPVKLSQIHTDNHIASAENQHNADARSDSQSPERSDGGAT